MKNKILFIVISLLFTTMSFSQTSPDNDIPVEVYGFSKTKALAKHALKIGDAYSALYYYEKLHNMRPDDLSIIEQLATLYKITRNYESASLAYGQIYEGDKFKYQYALYEKGIMQKMFGQYDSAIVSLEEYKRVGGKAIEKNRKRQLRTDIQGCDSAIYYLDFPENVEVKNLGESVNNPHVEFGPIPFDTNIILFGSLTSDTVHFYDNRYGKKETVPHRKFYTAEKTNGEWLRQGEIEEINDLDFEMGKIVYSPKSSTYYYTKCKKNAKGVNRCSIYSSKVKKGKIEKEEELPAIVNMPGYTTTQPTVYYDSIRKKEYVYFASNRPGSKGGLDIFYTYYDKRKKTWKKPKGLNKINTVATECTPFYNIKENALYYSTDGRPGMGGLDVFKLEKDENGKYLPIQNLGSPINSPQDDLDFSVYPDGQTGFVVSNRPGGTPYLHETCCDDIFEFEYLPLEPFDADLNMLVTTETGDTLTFDQVIVEKTNLRTKKVSQDTISLTTGSDIYYLNPDYHYDFLVSHEGYESDTFSVDTKRMYEHEHVLKTITLKKIKEKEPEVIDTLTNVVAVVEEPVLVVETEPEEVTLEPEVIVETKPEEVNPEPEFIDTLTNNVVAVVEEPKEVTPEPEVVAESKPEEIEIVAEEKIEKEEEVWPPKDTFKPNEKIRLNILYAFDKFLLTNQDKKELDSLLIPYMKLHTDSKAILSSHTDNWGSNIYNQYLSEQRAKNVVKYLIANGIAEERVSWKGYGESKPFVPNSVKGVDSIANRKLNRRTEVEIVY